MVRVRLPVLLPWDFSFFRLQEQPSCQPGSFVFRRVPAVPVTWRSGLRDKAHKRPREIGVRAGISG